MDKNNLNIPNQFGYKKSHSTESLLIQIVDEILIASDKKSATVIMLLDLSAAFDTVDHNKLIRILEKEIGIVGSPLRWFRSFITNRTQKVKIGNVYSEEVVLKYGVPQGSVLGPVLFNIYIRSLYKHVNGTTFNIKGFADDHQVYKSFLPIFQKKVLIDDIKNCFKSIKYWMDFYFLKLNSDKTEIIVFSPSNYLKGNLIISGTFLEQNGTCVRFANTASNLGVLFDKFLTFEPQVNKIVSTCFYTIKNLSKIRDYLSLKDLKILVCSLVLSKLDYCNSLLYGINGELLRKLQSVQNAAARLIFRKRKFGHISESIKELH